MSNLDPRTRLVIGISAVTAVLMSVHAATLIGAGVLLLIMAPLTGQMGRFTKSLRMTLPLTAFVFVVGLIFYDVEIALQLALRLFVLFSTSILVFGATGPAEIGDALRLLGFPYALAFMITSGMRYVPLIGLKVRHITEAQRSRGIDLAFKLRNVKNLIALLMPLLFQSFILADDLAVAMESRGFGRKGRSFRKSYRFIPTDWMVTILCLAALAVFLYLERG